jgi:signal transduction histidine kinase
LQLIAPELRTGAIRLRLHLADKLPPVDVDRIQVEQVMLNLVRNGIEAMESVPAAERVLDLETRVEPDGNVSFAVQDSGQGLSDQVVPYLFEPFFSTKPGGTGLGLSISRSIIADLHEGTLWVRPQEPRGARCGFSLRPAGTANEQPM